MQDKNKHIDEAFRNKLLNYEVAPPPAVWDRVAASMDNSKKKRKMIWLWRSMAAAMLALAFTGAWHFANRSIEQQDFTAQIEEINGSQEQNELITLPIEQSTEEQTTAPETLKPIDSKTLANKKPKTTSLKTDRQLFASAKPLARKPVFLKNIAPLSNLSGFENHEVIETDKVIIAANLIALSHEKPTSNNQKERWAIGIKGSPIYNNEQINFDGFGNKEYAPLFSDIALSNNVNTSYKMSLAGGVNVSYKTNDKISFTTGVHYNEVTQESASVGISYIGQNWLYNSNEQIRDEAIYAGDKSSSYTENNVMLNTQTGVANINLTPGLQLNQVSKTNALANDMVENYDLKQLAGYIEIPFLMRYQLIDKQMGLYFLGGINTNLLVSNNILVYNQHEVVGKGVTEGLRDIALSSSIGVGLNYELSKHFSLSFEPTVKLFLNTLNTQNRYNSKPYTLGVFSGISYQF